MKNMGYLLKLLSVTFVASGPVIATVSVNTNWTLPLNKTKSSQLILPLKSSLSNIKYLKVYPSFEANKKYCDLNDIFKNAPEFTKPFTKEPIIKYYNDANFGEEITNNKQIEGETFYLAITAAKDDHNWAGATRRIRYRLFKWNQIWTKLSKIKKLTIRLHVDENKKYYYLNNAIKKAPEFIMPFTAEPFIKYFDAPDGNEITDNNQKAGPFWVLIIASDNDRNWVGATGIKLELLPNNVK